MVPRQLTAREIAVIRTAIEKAAMQPLAPGLLDQIESLRVIGRCDCGCDSVDFVADDPQNPSRLFAHGTGKTPAGGDVGIIIWGNALGVTGIEVYDLGAGDDDIRLPVKDSIRPW